MKVIEAPVYRSDDGLREFKSQDECIEYEKFILLRAIIHKHARGIVYQAEVANFILKAWSEISLAMQHNGEARAIESAAQPALAAVPLTDEKIDHTLATTLDEFARTTRGMSHALDVNADITANSRLRRMFARAVLAAQPADAQQEPNMRHPKIQALIGKNARQHIWMMLVEQLVEDPHFETTAMDMEYWDTLHDKLKEKLTAAQPAPAAVPLTDEQIDDICWNFNCSNTPLVEYDRLIARAIEAAHGIAAAGDKP